VTFHERMQVLGGARGLGMEPEEYEWAHRVWRRYCTGTYSPWFLSRQDICRAIARRERAHAND
jgi:hypothetical protein